MSRVPHAVAHLCAPSDSAASTPGDALSSSPPSDAPPGAGGRLQHGLSRVADDLGHITAELRRGDLTPADGVRLANEIKMIALQVRGVVVQARQGAR